MAMIKIFLVAFTVIVTNIIQVHADSLEEAYKRGYEDGYKAAGTTFLPGSSTVLGGSGPSFKAVIAPAPGTNFQIGQDSTVAIIPKDALSQFKDKLGKDFIYDNKILMNDSAAAK
ncbi:hypothetical protein [Mesorhizobium hawassense]|nr:hypothetical protein [Mesorhizobium hawassense]